MQFPNRLRIAVMPLRHVLEFRIDEDEMQFAGGVEAHFVDILAKVLGFQYQLLLPDDRQWGRLSSGENWTGMIGMVQRNEADIAIGDLTITETRSKVVDFIPYSIEDITFATRLPNTMIQNTFYLQPFQWQVWLTCLILVTLMPMFFKKLLKKQVTWQSLYLAMIGNLLNQPFSLAIEDCIDKLILGVWLIFSFLLSSSYTALLLSSLTIPVHESGIRNIKDLSLAVAAGRFKCMTNLGSANIDLLIESSNKHLRILGKHIIEENWLSSSNAVMAPVEIKEFEAIMGPRWFFILEYGDPPFTTKYLFKEAVAFWNIGIAVNKGFCCKKELRTYISRMLNVGIFNKLNADELSKTRMEFLSNGVQRNGRHKALSLEDLLGIFLLWIEGCSLATIVCLLEIVRHTLIVHGYIR